MASMTQRKAAPSAEVVDYAERTRRLVPLIAARASDTERGGEIAPDVMQAFQEAGLLRLLAPRSVGGAAISPDRFVEVIEIMATADASTAWCVNQTSVCSAAAAFMSPQAMRAIFGPPHGLLAWGTGPKTRAVEIDGAYRVTGTWQFASGSRHATWLGGQCVVYDADGKPRLGASGKPLERNVFFPRDSARVEDVWQVMGLKGTGSDTYSVADLVVPQAHSGPAIADWIDTTPSDPAPLYRFPGSGLYAAGFGGIALGNARGMLDTFIAFARGKTPRGAKNPLCESPVVQMQVAQAHTRLEATRTYLLHSLREIVAAVRETDRMTVDQRLVVRAAGTYAIHQGTEVVEALYRAVGSTAIFENGPFERRFRDAYSISQHLQGRLAHFEQVGKHLLGEPTDLMFA